MLSRVPARPDSSCERERAEPSPSPSSGPCGRAAATPGREEQLEQDESVAGNVQGAPRRSAERVGVRVCVGARPPRRATPPPPLLAGVTAACTAVSVNIQEGRKFVDLALHFERASLDATLDTPWTLVTAYRSNPTLARAPTSCRSSPSCGRCPFFVKD